MYVVHTRISVPPEGADAFQEVFVTSMRETLGGVPGLERALLLKPTAEDQPWISTMEFDTKENYAAWVKSDSFKASHKNAGDPGMQVPIALEFFDVVEGA